MILETTLILDLKDSKEEGTSRGKKTSAKQIVDQNRKMVEAYLVRGKCRL
jgi:hypothetical protein